MPLATDASIVAERSDPSCTLEVTAVPMPEGGPEEILNGALADVEVIEVVSGGWELASGCPAATRAVLVRQAGERRARCVTLAAALRGDDAILLRMEGPRYAAQRLGEDMRTVLEAVSFFTPQR